MSISQVNLFGEEFKQTKEDVSALLSKIKKPKKIKPITVDDLKKKSISFEQKLPLIEAEVHSILGSYEENTLVIRDYNEFCNYIDKAIFNNLLVIDTETNNSLNVIDCDIMGLCLYTPGMKQAYIPVNHVDPNTLIKLDNQITEEQIKTQLERVKDCKLIFHNAYFDIPVIYTTCGVRLNFYWDTMIAARIIDENELAGLKSQYRTHIDPSQAKYDIEHLFSGFEYRLFDPKLFALYAATDSYMTYKLYEYQQPILYKPENKDLLNLLFEIEFPVIPVLVDMKLEGIEIDVDYANSMSEIYEAALKEVDNKILAELDKLKPLIDAWSRTSDAIEKKQKKVYAPKDGTTEISKNYPYKDAQGYYKTAIQKSKLEQLANPIDMNSPIQAAIVIYDILKAPIVDWKTPRGTGKAIIKELSYKYDICKLLLEKRNLEIVLNDFINKIPNFVQEKTGRLHCSFNSIGADTGRMSSSDPSLQQIPAHDKLVRMMFKARDGYSIVGADYSGQEPRTLCSFAKDDNMREAYEKKQDLYSVIASKCYHNSYEDNLEHDPRLNGKTNPEGKARRANGKTVLLGTSYGMSAGTLAERMNLSRHESQQIIDDYYNGFPGVKQFTQDSQDMLKKLGYVTDIYGRRRHLPDAQLDDYTITREGGSSTFNPLLGAVSHEDEALKEKIEKYREELNKAKWKKDVDKIIARGKLEGLSIRNNKGFISRALRQCLNARIQGSAASMTKKAMVLIGNDKELKDLGAKLLVSVHDEVFMEAPSENAEAVGKRLCDLMIQAAKEKCSFTPWSVDPYIVVDGWYEDENLAEIRKDYLKLITGDIEKGIPSLSNEEALNKIHEKYTIFKPDSLDKACHDTYVIGKDSLKYGADYYSNKK